MRKLLMAIVFMMSALAGMQPALGAGPIYVMRHLQKGDGADPSLSAEGAANARALAAMLGDKGVKAIFATPTRRAMETGAPLAEKLRIPVTPYDPSDPDALVRAIARIDGPVLVVGHSNTVPDLVARLGGKRPISMGDEDYGTVYVIARDGVVTALDIPRH